MLADRQYFGEDDIVDTNRKATSGDGTILTPPFVDPGKGGFQSIDGNPQNAIWADDLPWCYNEQPKPPDLRIPSSKQWQAKYHSGVYDFTDYPKQPEGKYQKFMTWPVVVRANGKLVCFLKGFSWEATATADGKTMISNVQLIPPLVPGTADYEKYFTGPVTAGNFQLTAD